MKKVLLSAIGLFLFGLAGTAQASMGERKWELNFNPGGFIPVGPVSNSAKSSFSLDASALYPIHEVVSFGVEAGYAFNSKNEGTLPSSTGTSGVGFTSDIYSRVFHLTPEIKLGPTLDMQNGSKLTPFIIGGGGYYWDHDTAGTITLTSPATIGGITLPAGTQISQGSADNHYGGWNIGAGVSLQLPQNFAVGAEFHYTQIIRLGNDNIQGITPSLRLTLLFD